MQRTLTIHRYSDPGHSWFKVPLGRIKELGLIDKFSAWSYLGNGYAFLEEDCDYSIFEQALIASNVLPVIVEHRSNKQSKVRGYRSYNPDQVRRNLGILNG